MEYTSCIMSPSCFCIFSKFKRMLLIYMCLLLDEDCIFFPWNMPPGEPPRKIKGSAPMYLPQLKVVWKKYSISKLSSMNK